jgi:hypothetical protein
MPERFLPKILWESVRLTAWPCLLSSVTLSDTDYADCGGYSGKILGEAFLALPWIQNFETEGQSGRPWAGPVST